MTDLRFRHSMEGEAGECVRLMAVMPAKTSEPHCSVIGHLTSYWALYPLERGRAIGIED